MISNTKIALLVLSALLTSAAALHHRRNLSTAKSTRLSERGRNVSNSITSPNTSITPIQTLRDEFTGFSLSIENSPHPSEEHYTLPSLALLAIAAMKEEALLDYHSPLLIYDFTDASHPENPIRISMAAAGAPTSVKLVRSSVMWAIKEVAVTMMRTHQLRYVRFNVLFRRRPLYHGVLSQRIDEAAHDGGGNGSAVAATDSALRSMVPPRNAVAPILTDTSSQVNHPSYRLTFSYASGLTIPRFRVFESILGLLLRFGKVDAAAPIDYISLTSHDYNVWIYMADVRPPTLEGPFQQFEAVAILEAIARYMVLQDNYREMTYRFEVDGQLFGQGCVTRPVTSRGWCAGLFPEPVIARPDVI